MPLGLNGGIIGLVNSSTRLGGATGIWSIAELGINSLVGLWPDPFSGTLIFANSSTWIVPTGVNQVDYLVVAGGGGGGAAGGGGGGAGGYLTGTSLTVTPGSTQTIVIGSGGAAGITGATGSNGTNSGIFTTSSGATLIWALGGGGGGSGTAAAAGTDAFDDPNER